MFGTRVDAAWEMMNKRGGGESGRRVGESSSSRSRDGCAVGRPPTASPEAWTRVRRRGRVKRGVG
jgi:hypothetical protein